MLPSETGALGHDLPQKPHSNVAVVHASGWLHAGQGFGKMSTEQFDRVFGERIQGVLAGQIVRDNRQAGAMGRQVEQGDLTPCVARQGAGLEGIREPLVQGQDSALDQKSQQHAIEDLRQRSNLVDAIGVGHSARGR